MKQEIEALLIANERILQLWDDGDLLNEGKQKHLKVSTSKLKVDSVYDVDEVTVGFKHDIPANFVIHLKTVREAMAQLEADPRIRKVIYESQTLDAQDDKKGEVIFTVISIIDK